jgi:hypothetical protein
MAGARKPLGISFSHRRIAVFSKKSLGFDKTAWDKNHAEIFAHIRQSEIRAAVMWQGRQASMSLGYLTKMCCAL